MANNVRSAEPLVLHMVRVNGFASPGTVADITGLDPVEAEEALAALAARDLLVFRDRLGAYGITADGRAADAAWVAEELATSGSRPVVDAVYERFLAQNEPFKAVCTEFQLAVADGRDREAAGRNALAALEPVHVVASEIVTTLTEALPRFEGYRRRFDSAIARLRAGDWDALAKPLAGSYHDAWMALHEDLLCSLGRRRGEHDGA